MKSIFIILISLTIFSCKNSNPIPTEDESHMELHKEMDKVDAEYVKFEKQLINLYTYSEKNPEKTILKIDSLLLVYKSEKDNYKSQIKSSVEKQLHYFKAELYYKLERYSESIKELEFDDHIYGDEAAGLAANYIKLKDNEKAKLYIDKIGGKGFYIYDYALGNYYESIGEKIQALKVYDSIKQDKRIKHYAYYKLAVNRLEELEKSNPKLLNEIYFPPGNPSFEICDSDNENRNKIFDLIDKLPENKNRTEIRIVESPQENDKNYYWVRVKTESNKTFNYYIYQETFEIKFLDTIKNNLMTLEEWRKNK